MCGGCRFRRSEIIWLAGNTFYGTRSIFEPAFLDWLENDFRLSEYEVQRARWAAGAAVSAGCGPR